MDDIIVEDAEWTGDTRTSLSYEHRSHLFQHPLRQTSTSLERKIRHSRFMMTKNKEKSNQNVGKEWRERSEPLVAVPEDEREHPPHYLPRLSVVLPGSRSSSSDHIPVLPRQPRLSHGDATAQIRDDFLFNEIIEILDSEKDTLSWENISTPLPPLQDRIILMLFLYKIETIVSLLESMTVVLSAFYAKLLIVLGLALPVTSTIQNELYTNITSDIFTMYLYITSMLFLAYTFYHLRIAKNGREDSIKRVRYGSFYLHMGVAGFSVGSIIYSCLQFGEYFDLSGDCQLIIVALKPALRILFMVAQTIFIFSYSDILDPMRGVVLDRFGLMHLIATNVCEWLNVVIQETRDDIVAVAYDRPALLRYTNITGPSKVIVTEDLYNDTSIETLLDNQDINITDTIHANITATIEAWTCNVSDMITPLIRSMNPYLRPCGVEYSLLCSIIIAVIWNDICTVPGSKSSKTFGQQGKEENQCCGRVKSNSHFSVDCGSAHKGLFMGVAVLAGTIVSLMLFNGLFQKENHVELALLQINIWETILFVIMTLSSGACLHRMRSLTLRRMTSAMPLEHALLLITQCGVYLYYLFQIIGASFHLHRYPEARRATRIISPLCAVIQSSCQTLLVLDAWSRRCGSGKNRPGRQLVTFLLVGNFALWLLNRVKNSRAEFHPLQMQFYGVWAWTLITHVSVPLLVCYRFQATVCFYEIWKNSYKRKKYVADGLEEEMELKNHSA